MSAPAGRATAVTTGEWTFGAPEPPDWAMIDGRPKGFISGGWSVVRVSDPLVLPEFITVLVQA
jgi:hypothetical protein